jgi:hypothetical protein
MIDNSDFFLTGNSISLYKLLFCTDRVMFEVSFLLTMFAAPLSAEQRNCELAETSNVTQ